jgi:hypothetical protein
MEGTRKMTSLLRNLCLAGLLAGSAVAAWAAEFQGVLMDKTNSANAELRIEPGGLLQGGMVVAEAYTRETALKPENQKAGYGIYTSENKFLPFDEAGNKKALAALKATKKEDDLRVEVTGEMKGDTLKVVSLKFL